MCLGAQIRLTNRKSLDEASTLRENPDSYRLSSVPLAYGDVTVQLRPSPPGRLLSGCDECIDLICHTGGISTIPLFCFQENILAIIEHTPHLSYHNRELKFDSHTR